MSSWRISSVGRKGQAGVIALLAVLLALSSVANLAFGAAPIPVGEEIGRASCRERV